MALKFGAIWGAGPLSEVAVQYPQANTSKRMQGYGAVRHSRVHRQPYGIANLPPAQLSSTIEIGSEVPYAGHYLTLQWTSLENQFEFCKMGYVCMDDATPLNMGNLLIDESDHKAFDDALERFLETLSTDERMLYSPCSSADELLEGLRKLDVISKRSQKRVGGRLTKGIKKLNDCLQPYFEVVGIFIQSNPQYTALVWGALRLVLQVHPPPCLVQSLQAN
jgi:hypothetical protein